MIVVKYLLIILLSCGGIYHGFGQNSKKQINKKTASTQKTTTSADIKIKAKKLFPKDTTYQRLYIEQHAEYSKAPAKFPSVKYDSVRAYDILDAETGKLKPIVSKGKIIRKVDKISRLVSPEKIKNLLSIINDTGSYGRSTAACFNPRMGVVFFKNNKIIAHITICLECNYAEFSEPVKAELYPHHFYWHGFSIPARQKLKAWCKSVGLKQCSEEHSPMFDGGK